MNANSKTSRLVTANDKERHASWLELFFDLVFVVTISGLADHLLQSHHAKGLIQYGILFLFIWWLWMGMSYYADQFNVHDKIGHVAWFAAMFGILVLNTCLPTAFSSGWKLFGLVYFLMRLLLILLYCRSYYDTPESRELLRKYIAGFVIAAILWLVSLAFQKPVAFVFWGIAMCIDFFTPIISYVTTKNIPAQASHMDERFGLFVIIVLGETIIEVSHSLTPIFWSFSTVAVVVIGFLIAISFWQQYFSDNVENIIHNALRSNQKKLFLSFVYGYGHLFIFMSIVSFGVGLQLFIMRDLAFNTFGFWIAIVSIIVFTVTNQMIRWSARQISG